MGHMIRLIFIRLVRHFDYFLLGCLICAMLVGLFVLYSASGESLE